LARGLGAEIAKAALEGGDSVVTTARKAADVEKVFPEAGDRLLVQSVDVTDPDAPVKAVTAALARFRRIDVLVNNAGYGQLGLFEESSEEDVERQFATNVFGLMRITRAVLPALREQRAGHIINFSSIAGAVQGAESPVAGRSGQARPGDLPARQRRRTSKAFAARLRRRPVRPR
jgi:NAD(P)-dependent dehydrogenase (short-subunit alcohol dehydrogenase family)